MRLAHSLTKHWTPPISSQRRLLFTSLTTPPLCLPLSSQRKLFTSKMSPSKIPSIMRAAQIRDGAGPPENLFVSDQVPVPQTDGENNINASGNNNGKNDATNITKRNVLIKISHTALNRACLLQRDGKYPPPPGASNILGLEAAGEVVQISNATAGRSWAVGDKVMALLEGGGYAEFAAVPSTSLMRAPTGPTGAGSCIPMADAAGIPEVWLTAFQLLSTRVGRLKEGERVLIHAAASSVGLAAIQLAKQVFKASHVTGVLRSPEKAEICRLMGADEVVIRSEFLDSASGSGSGASSSGASSSSGGRLAGAGHHTGVSHTGYDLVLDPVVGGADIVESIKKCNRDARYVVYAAMGGGKIPDFPVGLLLMKSVSLVTSTLRARSSAYKADLIEEFEERALEKIVCVGPDSESGASGGETGETLTLALLQKEVAGAEPGSLFSLRDSTFALEDAADAHRRMEANENWGKIVLRI